MPSAEIFSWIKCLQGTLTNGQQHQKTYLRTYARRFRLAWQFLQAGSTHAWLVSNCKSERLVVLSQFLNQFAYSCLSQSGTLARYSTILQGRQFLWPQVCCHAHRAPFKKQTDLKGKTLLHTWIKFFPFKEYPFSTGDWTLLTVNQPHPTFESISVTLNFEAECSSSACLSLSLSLSHYYHQ